MLLSGENLSRVRVFTSDKKLLTFGDALLHKQSHAIEALVLRKSAYPMAPMTEYALSVSNIESFDSDGLMRLKIPARDLERESIFVRTPRFDALYSIGVEYPGITLDMDILPAEQKSLSAYNHFSMNRFKEFKFECLDEHLGPMKEVYLNPITFFLRYFAVEIGRGFSKQIAFITSEWLDEVDWSKGLIYLNVRKGIVLSGPIYRPQEQMNDTIENDVYQYTREADKIIFRGA